jgi:hypothetical protein
MRYVNCTIFATPECPSSICPERHRSTLRVGTGRDAQPTRACFVNQRSRASRKASSAFNDVTSAVKCHQWAQAREPPDGSCRSCLCGETRARRRRLIRCSGIKHHQFEEYCSAMPRRTYAVLPASIVITVPVMFRPASPKRNRAPWATSMGSGIRCSALRRAIFWR